MWIYQHRLLYSPKIMTVRQFARYLSLNGVSINSLANSEKVKAPILLPYPLILRIYVKEWVTVTSEAYTLENTYVSGDGLYAHRYCHSGHAESCCHQLHPLFLELAHG